MAENADTSPSAGVPPMVTPCACAGAVAPNAPSSRVGKRARTAAARRVQIVARRGVIGSSSWVGCPDEAANRPRVGAAAKVGSAVRTHN